MRIGHPSSPGAAPSDRAIRTAWLVSFAITIAAIAVLLFVKSAQAEPPGPLDLEIVPRVTEALADEEAEESAAEAEAEEGVDEDEEESEDEGEKREECGLRTARASALADASEALVRTQIAYTAFQPVRAAIVFRVSGPKGSATIGRARKHLSYSGAIRASEHLSKAESTKVLAARTITVTVRVLDTPSFCHRYFDRHLRSRRLGGDQVGWQQSDSVFGR